MRTPIFIGEFSGMNVGYIGKFAGLFVSLIKMTVEASIRNILLLPIFLLSLSCKELRKAGANAPLKQWILDNQELIDRTSDTIINEYYKRNKIDSNWVSATVAITNKNPNALGELAFKAAEDSADCIVVLVSFYKDPRLKKNIAIAATDSLCLGRLNTINLPLDSTANFTFGIQKKPLN